jgi:hypothetical protein
MRLGLIMAFSDLRVSCGWTRINHHGHNNSRALELKATDGRGAALPIGRDRGLVAAEVAKRE